MELGQISARGVDRVIRVAWTLADLAEAPRPTADQPATHWACGWVFRDDPRLPAGPAAGAPGEPLARSSQPGSSQPRRGPGGAAWPARGRAWRSAGSTHCVRDLAGLRASSRPCWAGDLPGSILAAAAAPAQLPPDGIPGLDRALRRWTARLGSTPSTGATLEAWRHAGIRLLCLGGSRNGQPARRARRRPALGLWLRATARPAVRLPALRVRGRAPGRRPATAGTSAAEWPGRSPNEAGR